jgi:drug/metabolite transporter (DMT)-like permease
LSKTLLGTLSGLAAASIWGAMYVVSKVVLDVIPPFALITCRLVLGSLALWLVLGMRPRSSIARHNFWRIFGVGAIGYGVSLGFQFIGTKLSSASNASLVTSATPAFILIFSAWLLKERITGMRVLALVAATIGVVAVIDPRNSTLDAPRFLGNLALLAAALTWALYSVLIRMVTRESDVLTVSLVAFLGGLPIAFPAAAVELRTIGIGQATLGTVLGVLFLGLIATALAMLLWNTAFALVEASRVSLTFFAQPIVGTLLSWLLLKEAITPLFLIGGVLIAAGVLLASRREPA